MIKKGRVGRFLKDDVAKGEIGFLDDQSYTANAALDLYEATHDPRYVAIAREMLALVRADVQGVQVSAPFGKVSLALDVLR